MFNASYLVPAQVLNVHPKEYCVGSTCTIHYQTRHKFRFDPQFFDGNTGAIYRVCQNRGFHLDPDEVRVPPGHVEPDCCK